MKSLLHNLPLCLVAGMTACSFGGHAPQHRYVLDPAPATASRVSGPAATLPAMTLLVAPTSAASFYGTQAIVYSPATGMRAYYQLNSWTEPPNRRLAELLTERLRQSGWFSAVTTATGGARGALVLDTELDEFLHDTVTPPGSARISLTATLTDPTRHVVAGQHRFVGSAPALSGDAAGAVQAFDVALATLLDEVVAWVGKTAAEHSQSAQ